MTWKTDETPLDHVVSIAMRGDDKFKRWPLPEMVVAQDQLRAFKEVARAAEPLADPDDLSFGCECRRCQDIKRLIEALSKLDA